MAVGDKIISFWKQVKLKSSDMFTLFRVGVGVKFPTHKFHVKDSTDPVKIEGLQNDATDPDKFLTIDANNIVKYRTGSEVLSDIGGTPLTNEQVQDIVGAMFTSNTETNITVTYQDADGTIDLASTDTNTQLSTEEVQDIVGAMFTGNTETNITVTYQDADGTIDLAATDTNTQLTTEEVQDIIGAMLSSNTETNITVTYQDSDGTIDFEIGTLNQDTTGNAATATALETARAINGVDFNGTAPITVTAAGSTLSDTVPVSKGGTGATSLAADSILTGNGTNAVVAEGFLSYSSSDEEMIIGNPDAGDAQISRRPTSGTDTAGGKLIIAAGAATGNAAGGSIEFHSSVAGSSGSTVQSTTEIATIDKDGNLSIDGDLTVKGNDIKDDDGTTCITFDSSGNTTVANTLNASVTGNVTGNTSGSSGSCTGNSATATSLATARNIGGVSFNGTGDINLPGVNTSGSQDTSGNADTATALTAGNKTLDGNLTIGSNGAGHDLLVYGDTSLANMLWDSTYDFLKFSDAAKIVFGSGVAAADFDSSIQGDGSNLVIYNDTGNIQIGDTVEVTGDLSVTGSLTAKQREIYFNNFEDKIGTSKVYIPLISALEQSSPALEESCFLAPCDGRIVSVTVRPHIISAGSDCTVTVDISTMGLNVSSTGSFTAEESKNHTMEGADDYHAFHYVFDNAKHFESGELVAIGIQSDVNIDSGPYTMYWYVSTVVEYDWNNQGLTAHQEYSSAQ